MSATQVYKTHPPTPTTPLDTERIVSITLTVLSVLILLTVWYFAHTDHVIRFTHQHRGLP